MKATIDDNLIRLKFAFDFRIKEKVKAMPDSKFDGITKTWTIPLEWANQVLPTLEALGFAGIDDIRVKSAEQTDALGQLNVLAGQQEAEFESKLPLLPYQKVGATFLAKIKSGLLGDDVGLGKTIQTLAVIEADPSIHKVLILCPAILKYQWEAEIQKFLGEETATQVIGGTKAERTEKWNAPSNKFYIANYELLLRDFDLINQGTWDYIVADEASKISNPRSKTSQSLKKLKARNRLALTGTPISNKPNEVWNIIDFTNPGVLGNYYKFVDRYCIRDQYNGIFGYQNLEELQKRIRRYMIRRTKEQVLPELPEKITKDLPFDLSFAEHTLYKKLKQEMLFEIEAVDISKMADPATIQMALVKMMRLQQLADSMELIGEKKDSTKLDVLKELIDEELKGRKIIVFTKFAQMADILQRELGGFKISGSVNQATREAILSEFNNPASPVFKGSNLLIMTSAGQFGLNIQSASVVIHYDQEWSLAKMTQREGRAHRYGQKQTVLVYNLLARGTIDFYVQKKLLHKSNVAGQVFGDAPINLEVIKQMVMYGEE